MRQLSINTQRQVKVSTSLGLYIFLLLLLAVLPPHRSKDQIFWVRLRWCLSIPYTEDLDTLWSHYLNLCVLTFYHSIAGSDVCALPGKHPEPAGGCSSPGVIILFGVGGDDLRSDDKADKSNGAAGDTAQEPKRSAVCMCHRKNKTMFAYTPSRCGLISH